MKARSEVKYPYGAEISVWPIAGGELLSGALKKHDKSIKYLLYCFISKTTPQNFKTDVKMKQIPLGLLVMTL